MAYPIPAGALNQHVIVLGKTRSGKSSKMRLLVEGLLDESKPVCIIDPKGDWWGLKSSADGRTAGYPVIIFGGEHADVPINEHSGAHIAELIATGNRPCIIDLGGWMVGARTRFFVDFAATLFKLTRGPRWLVIDECHNFAPQGRVLDPDAGKMLHWANRLASEGSGKGLTLISASQRPQKVHKDYVTSHETLIATRVIHPLDRGAIKDWIDGCADPQIGRDVIAAIAGLDRSQAYVWSPEIGFGPELVTFPMFKTYDSFKAQDHDAPTALKGWATVDLDDVKVKLARVVEEAKANDPKALKAEIARLKAEAAKPLAPAPAAPTGPTLAEVEEIKCAAFLAGVEEGEKRGNPAGQALMLARVRNALDALKVDQATSPSKPPAKSYAGPPPPSPAPRSASIPESNAPSSASSGVISGPIQKLIDAVAHWEAFGLPSPTVQQVAFMAGYASTSGTWDTYRSRARTMGLIELPGGGKMRLTDAGRAAASSDGVITSPQDLHLAVKLKLAGPLQRLLDVLLAAYPETVSRADWASGAGYEPTSGTADTYRSRIMALDLATSPERGVVRAADWLFPGAGA
jgi:hypothetical protein